jgi:hypothetical protein
VTIAAPLLERSIAAGAAAHGVLPRVADLPKIAPLMPAGPLRVIPQAIGDPVGTGIGAVLDAGHRAAGVGSSAGREAGRFLQPSPVPSSSGLLASRLVMAIAAGLLTLEVVSQISGRYFTWSPAQGAAKVTTAAQYIGLYPGQAAHLASVEAAPSAATAAEALPAAATQLTASGLA